MTHMLIYHIYTCLYTLRYILQTYYGLTIESMKLASFHPSAQTYGVVDVPLLDDETSALIEHYLDNRG